MAYGYGAVHAKNIGELVELRFKFAELQEKRQEQDKKEGKPKTGVNTELSNVRFKLDK